MPTVFAHALVAFTGARLLRLDPGLTGAAVACAVVPDLDVFAPAFGVPWSSFLAHRGFTHTLGFALLVGIALSLLVFRRRPPWRLDTIAALLALATLTHPLLDMLTNGGRAIPILWPFDDARHFFPWRPIEVSPFIGGFFSRRGLEVIANELVWIGLPCVALVVADGRARRAQARRG
jgi:inner membrane protein